MEEEEEEEEFVGVDTREGAAEGEALSPRMAGVVASLLSHCIDVCCSSFPFLLFWSTSTLLFASTFRWR